MPTLKLTAGKPASTRTAPKRKPAPAAKAPGRKPPATKAPARKAKPAAAAPQDNGAATRGPKLPEGWTKRDFDKLIKDMDKTLADKADAQTALDEAQFAVNVLALNAINEGIQMSVVSENLKLSRQWLYHIMKHATEYGFDGEVVTERMVAKPHPNKGLTQEQIEAKAARDAAKKAAKPKAAPKRTAKAKPAAKRSPARKPPASSTRKAPARRTPARGAIRLAA